MDPSTTSPAALAAAVTAIAALCHLLVALVATWTNARAKATTARTKLAALESGHGEYVGIKTRLVVLYIVLLVLHCIGWLVEIALVANFALYVASLFGGGRWLRLILVLFFSLTGVCVVIGVGLMLDDARIRRDEKATRLWKGLGLLVCALSPILIGVVMLAVGTRHGMATKAALLTNLHLAWLMIIIGIYNAILIFAEAAGTAKAYGLFKVLQWRLRRTIARQDAIAVAADGKAVHTWMTLSFDIRRFKAEHGVPPTLPDMNFETEAWAKTHFRQLTPTDTGRDDEMPSAEGAEPAR